MQSTLTVVLGITYKRIKDILEFGPGSIIEFNTLAADPININCGSEAVAEGRVVVIDDKQMGIKVTGFVTEKRPANPEKLMGENESLKETDAANEAKRTQQANDSAPKTQKANLELIKDVPLKITVLVGNVCEYGNYPFIHLDEVLPLDRYFHEPLDILVNGMCAAVGEAVVIDENLGVRITDIIHPPKRLHGEPHTVYKRGQ